MYDLQEYYNKGLEIVNDCGIEVKYPTTVLTTLRKNACNTWGKIRTDRRTMTSTIKINQLLLDEKATHSDKPLLTVMVHEILHSCCPSCYHNKEWKALAKIVSERYALNIKTTNPAKEYFTKYGLERLGYKTY